MDENRRKRIRVETHRVVDFTSLSGEVTPLETRNVSLKGLLAAPSKQIQTGDKGTITISLGTDVSIETECTVIRSDAQGLAIQFLGMEPQSFMHLRNLVRYNAEDADEIDFELASQRFT